MVLVGGGIGRRRWRRQVFGKIIVGIIFAADKKPNAAADNNGENYEKQNGISRRHNCIISNTPNSFSAHISRGTDKFLLKFSSCSRQSRSQAPAQYAPQRIWFLKFSSWSLMNWTKMSGAAGDFNSFDVAAAI